MRQIQMPYSTKTECNIVSVGKRRDGGTRFWCLEHKADATAKYGKKSKKCRYADLPLITEAETFDIDIQDYPGGIALWGAVPPIYDTTTLPLDKGIHIHARKKKNGEKTIDQTFRKVKIIHESGHHVVSELDAIYYMVSSVLGFKVKLIHCTRCGYPHLDKDWFSVHPHQSHLCSGCGKNFRDNEIAVGNPVASLQNQPFSKKPIEKKSRKHLKIKQKDFRGGIQIWGSNPSILWTSDRHQESGIHIHAFRDVGEEPEIDETFNRVEIDGISLDESQVRTYMAQLSLPHLAGRIQTVACATCNQNSFDKGHEAFSPRVDKKCSECGSPVQAKGRLRKVISNPILITLEEISKASPRPVQQHDLGLLPETI